MKHARLFGRKIIDLAVTLALMVLMVLMVLVGKVMDVIITLGWRRGHDGDDGDDDDLHVHDSNWSHMPSLAALPAPA
jgi:hypothetical protein